MSSNNDQAAMLSMQLAVLFIGIAFLAVAALAAAAFAALLLTFAALFAWNRPKRFGPIRLTPHKAHAIISNGVGGGLGVPLGVILVQLFAQKPIPWPHLPLVGVGAYAVVALLTFKFGSDQPEDDEEPVPAPVAITHTRSAEVTDRTPRFASWDDEEELK